MQTDNDLSFLTSEHAVQYVRELESSTLKSKDNHRVLNSRMTDLIKGFDTELKNIAMNFLQINPYFRLTAYEALTECRIFDSVRDPRKEDILRRMGGLQMPKTPMIELAIDDLDAFDYENADKAKYTVKDLHGILSEEIMYFRLKNDKINLTNGTCSTSTGG